MYQENHLSKDKQKRSNNKPKAIVLLTSLILLLTMTISGMIAFLVAKDEALTNTFKDSTVTCEVQEDDFKGITKTNVTIKNTGDTEAYIRAAIVVTWKDSDDNIYGGKPVAETDYTISLDDEDWFLGDDGFYYYKAPVDVGESTSELIYSCSPIAANTPEGYGLNVEILGSAIQSVPTSVVEENWGVTVNSNILSESTN